MPVEHGRLLRPKLPILDRDPGVAKVAFGTVNAVRRHYHQAADALARADPDWLGRLITRRLPPENWPVVLEKHPEDIKVVVDMTASA